MWLRGNNVSRLDIEKELRSLCNAGKTQQMSPPGPEKGEEYQIRKGLLTQTQLCPYALKRTCKVFHIRI